MNSTPGPGPDLPDAWGTGAPAWTVPPQPPPPSSIELWKPLNIGVASVILGFPGAVILAALNWHRMGRTGKAILHLIAVVIGTWALVLGDVGFGGLLISVVVGYYLYRAQQSDQSAFVATGRVTERNGLVAVVIALAGTVLILVSAVLVADTVPVDRFTHRGEVLFSTHAIGGDCSVQGSQAVFGQTEPIFYVATMRETVKPGSRVVVQVQGPGMTDEAYPIAVEPPFDCLVAKDSVGTFDPGTYVVHFRYEGQPGSPDLATGTFIVRPGPGGS